MITVSLVLLVSFPCYTQFLNEMRSCSQIQVWCQFHPHSFDQSFNGDCTIFTKGVSSVGR